MDRQEVEPVKGEFGLWYVPGTLHGFPSREQALEHWQEREKQTAIGAELKRNLERARAEQRRAERTAERLRWVPPLVLAVLAIGAFYGLQRMLSEPSAEERAARAESRLQRQCEATAGHEAAGARLVKGQMKSPSTAKVRVETANYLGDCKALLSGTVEAQNSFGVTLRQGYLAVTRFNKGAERYELDSFEITSPR